MKARPTRTRTPPSRTPRAGEVLTTLIDEVVSRVRDTPVELASLDEKVVPGSLYAGAAGVAFFLYEAARLRDDEDLVPLAQRWCALARAWTEKSTSDDWYHMPHGFLMGSLGVAYVECLVASRMGDDAALTRAVEAILRTPTRLSTLGQGTRPTELVGGTAGVVCALRDLDARLGEHARYEALRGPLRELCARAAEALLEALASPIKGRSVSFGIAHGVAGELWALLGTHGARHEVVHARLAELARRRGTDEHGLIYWLPENAEPELVDLTAWCRGITGHALLWCEVSRQHPTRTSRALAESAARTTAALRANTPGICCGLAGQALALQRYATLYEDRRMARLAHDRLVRAAREVRSSRDLSLWQGAPGIALVAMYRARGEHTIPCIETALRAEKRTHREKTP